MGIEDDFLDGREEAFSEFAVDATLTRKAATTRDPTNPLRVVAGATASPRVIPVIKGKREVVDENGLKHTQLIAKAKEELFKGDLLAINGRKYNVIDVQLKEIKNTPLVWIAILEGGTNA